MPKSHELAHMAMNTVSQQGTKTGLRRTVMSTLVRHSARCCGEKWLLVCIVITLNIHSLIKYL